MSSSLSILCAASMSIDTMTPVISPCTFDPADISTLIERIKTLQTLFPISITKFSEYFNARPVVSDSTNIILNGYYSIHPITQVIRKFNTIKEVHEYERVIGNARYSCLQIYDNNQIRGASYYISARLELDSKCCVMLQSIVVQLPIIVTVLQLDLFTAIMKISGNTYQWKSNIIHIANEQSNDTTAPYTTIRASWNMEQLPIVFLTAQQVYVTIRNNLSGCSVFSGNFYLHEPRCRVCSTFLPHLSSDLVHECYLCHSTSILCRNHYISSKKRLTTNETVPNMPTNQEKKSCKTDADNNHQSPKRQKRLSTTGSTGVGQSVVFHVADDAVIDELN